MGREDIVDHLLKNGADVEAADINGNNVIAYGANHPSLIKHIQEFKN